MNIDAVLADALTRVRDGVPAVIDGLDEDDLAWRPDPDANSIAWLVWHLTRVQDHHIAEILDTGQLWEGGDWAGRFGLDADPSNTGYGHSPEEVAAVRPERPDVLLEYLDAVDARTRAMLRELTPSDLDRIVDRSWDPPVTLGVRLVSIADDSLQHAGQAAYVRGLLGA